MFRKRSNINQHLAVQHLSYSLFALQNADLKRYDDLSQEIKKSCTSLERLYQGFYETRMKYFLWFTCQLPLTLLHSCFTHQDFNSLQYLELRCSPFQSRNHYNDYKCESNIRVILIGIIYWKEVVQSYFVFSDPKRDHLLRNRLFFISLIPMI